MFQIVKAVFAFILLCAFVLPASAFVPDDGELSMGLQKNYGGLSSWEAEMSFPDFPSVSVHLWYARGKWRQEWRSGDTATAVGLNGTVTGQCTADIFPLSPMFVWMTPDPVGTWKAWGVDNATSSFGFCDGEPCYMFGADPSDETSPSVQLNNEDMSPLLIRYVNGGQVTSVKYADYRTFGGFRVPQSVVLSMDGALLKANVKWIAVNRAESEKLYDRDAVDLASCAEPPSPFDILRNSFQFPLHQ